MSETSLVKDKVYEVTPGIPGTSDIPGVPVAQGTPAHYSTKLVSVTTCLPTICSTATPVASGSSVGSAISGGGYNQPQPCSRAMVCHSEIVRQRVYHPATPGAPGDAGVPGTSVTTGELIEHLNEGWNSHSRSIDKLNVGEYLSYHVNDGIAGVLISIGINGKDGDKTNTFSHSILIEPAGVIVFENGVKTSTVKNLYNGDSLIRLYRQPDNKVICVVTNGSETLVHVFDNDAHILPSVPLNVYAHLYIADDSVEDALFKTGQVYFGEA